MNYFDKTLALYNEGKSVSEVVNVFAQEKIHHIAVSYYVRAAFKLSLDEVNDVLYAHPYYKPFDGEINPFNELFFKTLSEEE